MHLKNKILNSYIYYLRFRYLHKNKLTILGFHRVFSDRDERFVESNPQWTITNSEFRDIIEILNEYFTIVSHEQVLNFYYNNEKLPSNPLLITFDDGWIDNYLYAFPILQEFKKKAVFFITTDAIGSNNYFWQEALFAYFIMEARGNDKLFDLARKININTGTLKTKPRLQQINIVIAILHQYPPSERDRILGYEYKEIIDCPKSFRLFMDTKELKEMHDAGMGLGSHGKTHNRITEAKNILIELENSKKCLESITGSVIHYFSWPQGSYNEVSLQACRYAGYRLAFSSDKGLNPFQENALYRLKRLFMPTWRFIYYGDRKLSKQQIKESILLDL